MLSATPVNVKAWKMGLLILFMLSLSGCFTTKCFVDPTLPQVSTAEVKVPANPQPIHLLFEFKTEGNVNSSATEAVRPKVVALLERSKCFSQVTTTGASGSRILFVTMNNFTPTDDDPVLKGVGVGLTFGLAGAMVSDFYTLDASLQLQGKEPTKKTYEHALHSTVGNKDGPPGLAPMTLEEGFDRILEQLVMSMLRDLSADGVL